VRTSMFALPTFLALALLPPGGIAAQTDHHHMDEGPAGNGRIQFATRCGAAAQPVLEQGVALLHSFWYEASVAAFEEAARLDRACPFAPWGQAMSRLHPLWTPPTSEEGRAGLAAAELAVHLSPAGSRELDYASAILEFFVVFRDKGYRSGIFAWESAMAGVQARNPDDDEARIFHALSLIAAGQQDPTDTTYARQREAASLLDPLIARYPQHPGLAHYMIHAFDSPPLAHLARGAADQYAVIAPDVPHALHMPSHIYVRLGLWPEALASNQRSAEAGRRLEEREHWKGVWAQRLHAWDYLVYASLQLGQDSIARDLSDQVGRVTAVIPANDLVGDYALAAIPARYALEREDWAGAAGLPMRPAPAWPAAEALTHFARAIGAARGGNAALARHEIDTLETLETSLRQAGGTGTYWAGQVGIQRRAAMGWLAILEGDTVAGLRSSREAADIEDRTEKHPVTPGALLPARELYADLLLALNRPEEALANYRQAEARQPNRARTRKGIERANLVLAKRAAPTPIQ
jgi:tetratricopeptide (TPR) repeat protein